MSDFVTLVSTWIGIIAGSSGLCYGAWRYIINPAWKFLVALQQTVQEVQYLLPTVKSIHKELQPNGGLSLLDRIHRIDENLNGHVQRFHLSMMYDAKIAFETDLEGRCVWVTPKWEDLTGLHLGEATGWGWVNAIHPEDRAYTLKEWENAVKQTRPLVNVEYRYLHADTRVQTMVVMTAYPVLGVEGRVIGYFGIVKPK